MTTLQIINQLTINPYRDANVIEINGIGGDGRFTVTFENMFDAINTMTIINQNTEWHYTYIVPVHKIKIWSDEYIATTTKLLSEKN